MRWANKIFDVDRPQGGKRWHSYEKAAIKMATDEVAGKADKMPRMTRSGPGGLISTGTTNTAKQTQQSKAAVRVHG